MKVLIDVLGAPERSGGMRLYAEELVNAWSELEPDDEIEVVGNPWAYEAFESLSNVSISTVPEKGPYRIAGQWFYTAWLARRLKPDVVLSVSLVVTPLVGKRPRLCVVHDWRHVWQPGEFSTAQRWYRKSWVWSTNRATKAIQISEKTSAETARIAPRASRVVIENGQDHARKWAVVDPQAHPSPHRARILTFGHQSNKRPELVIGAISKLRGQISRTPELIVLGARGDYADELSAVARELHLEDQVQLPGFVSPAEYQRIVQLSDVIVLASTDEGFGLPVSEASYFGIPAVGTNDNGLDKIHSNRVSVSAPDPDSLAKVIASALDRPRTGRQSTTGNRWSDTARDIRKIALDSIEDGRA